MATMVIPERSLGQRLAALERANVVRTYRAGVKQDLKAGRMSVLDVLRDPDPKLDTMKVWDLLLAQPKIGRVKVGRIHSRVGISPSKTIGGLSSRQLRELRELRGWLR